MRYDIRSIRSHVALRLSLARVSKMWAPLPQPSDAPVAHAPGSNALRILLVGDGLVVGFGVLSHQLGFGGAIAAQLASTTKRGVDIQIIGDTEMTPQRCLERISQLSLGEFNAIVLMIGATEALKPAAEQNWHGHTNVLLQYLDDSGPPIFVVGTPVAERAPASLVGVRDHMQSRAAEMEDLYRDSCSASHNSTYLPVAAIAGRKFGQAPDRQAYHEWAAQIVPTIARQIGDDPSASDEQSENLRQDALDRLGVLDTVPEERFDTIARTALNIFGAHNAAITFLDHDRQYVKSAAGFERGDSPRVSAFCNVTIQSSGVFVVENARTDARFEQNPSVASGEIQFYAGYPIESPGGLRIGALCIADTAPRHFSPTEAALLRDLALRAQHELWSVKA